MSKITQLYPLNDLQKGLLFNHVLYSSHKNYLTQLLLLIKNFKIAFFKNACFELILNHKILRSGFLWKSLKRPLQYVIKEVEPVIIEEDWSGLDGKERRSRIDEYLEEDRNKGMDLSKAPLFRVSIIKCSKEEYYIVLTYHHIILDGWSTAIIMEELLELYDKLCKGEELQLKNRREYSEYIEWLEKQDKKKILKLWEEYLSGLDGITEINLSNLINEDKKFSKSVRQVGGDYGIYEAEISEDIGKEVRNYAYNNGFTLNTIIQGVIGVVLSKYTGREDLVYGITISGRDIDLEGIEEMVGLFINTLPLRIKVNKNKTIKNYLIELQNDTQFINEHGYVSLAEVQKIVNKDSSRLFDTILIFENYPVKGGSGGEKSFKLIEAGGVEKTEYPLTIGIGIEGDKIKMKLSYRTEKYDSELIRNIGENIRTGVSSLIKKRNKYVREIEVIGRGEKERIEVWNDTREEGYIGGERIEDILGRVARENRDRVAVVYGDRQVTYGELEEVSNQIGRYLREEKGVRGEELVVLCVERSEKMLMSILGIMKAGGGYVPIDPSYPEERIRYIIEDTKARVVISEGEIRSRIEEVMGGKKVEIIDIGEDKVIEEIRKKSKDRVENGVGAANIAYVIYTSGTTGKPKGVANSMGGVLNRLKWTIKEYGINKEDIFLQIASIGFDISYWEMLNTQMTGGKLVFTEDKRYKDSNYIMNMLIKNQISIVHFVPSYLEAILSNDKDKNNSKLRGVICGGEKVAPAIIKKLKNSKMGENCEVYHAYGPSEVSISVTGWVYDNQDRDYLPIGKAISNTQIYILDEGLGMVPIGGMGEICIGGVGLARGYIGKAGLSAEKFVANPYAKEGWGEGREGGSRIYKTGDLGRYLEDGNIEYIGRIDEQVKIRGYRIELGEIENSINSYEGIKQSVVIAKEHKEGEAKGSKYIVGYYVSEEEIEEEELIRYIGKKLPEYMVPNVFMKIGEVPLTINGKVDKKKLPEPELVNEDRYVAPRDEIEEKLSEIWSDVLGIERGKIGIYDNFFRLGGNSLMVYQLFEKINDVFVTTLILSYFNFLSIPTINFLSSAINSQIPDNKKRDLNIFYINKKEVLKDTLFFFHPSNGLCACYNGLKRDFYNFNLIGINSILFQDISYNVFSVEELANYYLNQIVRINNSNNFSLIGWSFGGLIAYEVAQQLSKLGFSIKNLIIIDTGIQYFNSDNMRDQEPDFSIYDKEMRKIVKLNFGLADKISVKYIPKKYNGCNRVVLFKSNDSELSTMSIWNKYIKKIKIIPLSTKHNNVFDDKCINNIITCLKKEIIT